LPIRISKGAVIIGQNRRSHNMISTQRACLVCVP
jgi:hypothetical protein